MSSSEQIIGSVGKCQDLSNELRKMWNIQAKLIPIVMGALGTVLRRLPEYLRNDWGRYVGGDDPKTALLGSSRTLREVMAL